MTVDGVSTATAQTTSSTTKETTKTATDVGSDFETFLTLLTTQMRNQDPLNPMDSTAFVAQLAEFSGVEQQVKSNDTLSAILEAVSGGGSGQLAQLVGMQVQAETSARYDGEPLELAFDPDPQATSAQLVVRDADGAIVARLPVDAAAETVEWDGRLDDGSADAGSYSFSQTRVGADGLTEEVPARVFAMVTELRLTSDGPRLMLDSGEAIEESAVTAIRG